MISLIFALVFYLFVVVPLDLNRVSFSKKIMKDPLTLELLLNKTPAPILKTSLVSIHIASLIDPVQLTKLQIYNKYLQRGKLGVAEAKYLVSSILNSCSSYMTLEQIDIVRIEESQFYLDGTLSLAL
jgi:hypothetical protein